MIEHAFEPERKCVSSVRHKTERRQSAAAIIVCAAVLLGGCASITQPAGKRPPVQSATAESQSRSLRAGLDPAQRPDPFPTTYRRLPSQPLAIINAVILTAAGPRIDGGTVLMRDGKVAAVGSGVPVPQGTRVIDAKGRWVTPGIVDPHSHIGVLSSPPAATANEGNETVRASSVWIENALWVHDPMFERAAAAGVTAMQILPGSANLVGGRSIIVKNVRARTPQDMKFPGAAAGMKMACGENPASGGPGPKNPTKPSSRQGNAVAFRTMLIAAQEYAQRWEDWRRKGTGDPPSRDLEKENLAAAIRGDLKIHFHCYRADDMVQMINLSHEFGFKITAFHHAVDAYKIAPLLAREQIGVAAWVDWFGYKMEAYDGIEEMPAFIEQAGGTVAMHSDVAEMVQHLNHDAGRAMTAGREAGLGTTPEQAVRWLTINPAKLLGIAEQTGSLEVGKMADVVLWSTDPFSIYSLPDAVVIDGALIYDRSASPRDAWSDFELGNVHRPAPESAPRPNSSLKEQR